MPESKRSTDLLNIVFLRNYFFLFHPFEIKIIFNDNLIIISTLGPQKILGELFSKQKLILFSNKQNSPEKKINYAKRKTFNNETFIQLAI